MDNIFEVRTSERRAWKRCPQRWAWGYGEGLKTLRDSNPLWFGTAVHDALARWYLPGIKRGPHPAETFKKYIDQDRSVRVQSEEDEYEYMSAVELGISMLENYVNTFGKDEQWWILSTEEDFQIWMPRPASFPEGAKQRWFRYDGTWDGVYRDQETGHIWLLEHKTAAGLNPQWLPLDDQCGSYWTLADKLMAKRGVIKKGVHLEGVMYNFLRKQALDTRPKNEQGLATNKPLKAHYLADDRFLRAARPHGDPHKWKLEAMEALAIAEGIVVLGEVSKQQPAEYFERIPTYRSVAERATQLRRVQDEAWHIEQGRRSLAGETFYPIVKNPTKDCSWDCEFYRMCQLHEQGDLESVEDFKETMFKREDPYAAHYTKSA